MNGDEATGAGSGGGREPGLAAVLAAGGGEKAEAYLDEATRLVRLQIEQLEEEQRFEHFHHFSAVMKALFEAAVALFVLAVLGAAGAMVWTAAHDDGLLIQSFSVPQEMAAQGLTGQVVAARLLDRLAQLQQQTQSSRAASSYANDWGDDIRVQIPETGVSVSQLYTYLSQWLGHQTHISGEVFHTADGQLAVAARVGAIASPTFTGKPGDFDALLQKAAERVYAVTQPYRYAVYLMNSGHNAEAAAIFHRLIAHGDNVDKAWAYVGLGTIAAMKGDVRAALTLPERALAIRPNFFVAWENIINFEQQLQHSEATHQDNLKYAAAVAEGDSSVDPAQAAAARVDSEIQLASDSNDLQRQLELARMHLVADRVDVQSESLRNFALGALAGMHDPRAAYAAIAALPDVRSQPQLLLNRDANMAFVYAALDDWQQAGAMLDRLEPALAQMGKLGQQLASRPLRAARAWVLAETGHLDQAKALIASTPLDCDLCVDIRGHVAVLAHDWPAAEHWFALQARHAPSLPAPFADWCQMRLEKGDADGAIHVCKLAHEKGPHWADPLEYWGEALLLKHQPAPAAAKFAEAAAYAPNWGRLHLKWGEALAASGQRGAAKKQFAVASHLVLTADEKAQLQRAESAHG